MTGGDCGGAPTALPCPLRLGGQSVTLVPSVEESSELILPRCRAQASSPGVTWLDNDNSQQATMDDYDIHASIEGKICDVCGEVCEATQELNGLDCTFCGDDYCYHQECLEKYLKSIRCERRERKRCPAGAGAESARRRPAELWESCSLRSAFVLTRACVAGIERLASNVLEGTGRRRSSTSPVPAR